MKAKKIPIKEIERLKIKVFIKEIAYTKGKFSKRKAIRALTDYYILLRRTHKII